MGTDSRCHLNTHRRGFHAGFTPITTLQDTSGIALGVLTLTQSSSHFAKVACETAWLLMQGQVQVELGDTCFEIERSSVFDAPPQCLHVPAGTVVRLHANSHAELTVYQVANTLPFKARHIGPEQTRSEVRGANSADKSAMRLVRTLFDSETSEASTHLVLGEVIAPSGHWSSYPPHHHEQPELYHYRFTAPQGYGHAEVGDAVFKVKQFDTVSITPGHDHAQAAAPGYGMYYSWVVRHLDHCRYTGPVFTEEHRWIMQPGASVWLPKELDHAE